MPSRPARPATRLVGAADALLAAAGEAMVAVDFAATERQRTAAATFALRNHPV